MKPKPFFATSILIMFLAASLPVVCGAATRGLATKLQPIGTSTDQWTGLAIGKDGGLFVNYPRWSDHVPLSVAHFPPDSDLHPFPDAAWNSWKAGEPGQNKFVCVQSVVLDQAGSLWVVDAGSPKMAGVIPGAPKLVRFDAASGKVQKIYSFDQSVAPKNSYLNDVRFDKDMKHAILSDSGAGAIVVLDIASGKARRLLQNSPATKSEHVAIVIDGKKWLRDGKQPDVHCDGIAIDPAGKYLYFDALTARTLYRIPVADLTREDLDEKTLAKKVERVASVGPNDGLLFGPEGYLYITDLAHKAITRWKPGMAAPTVYVSDQRLVWPDSLATGRDGKLYVSISRINEGQKPKGPYDVYSIEKAH
jgi:sugar lactone lactonase YvrE